MSLGEARLERRSCSIDDHWEGTVVGLRDGKRTDTIADEFEPRQVLDMNMWARVDSNCSEAVGGAAPPI